MLSSSEPYSPSPSDQGFFWPGEWSKQRGVWLAWPWAENLWGENFKGAQKAVLDLAKVVSCGGSQVNCLVPNASWKKNAIENFSKHNIPVKFFEIPFGDIWLRDIAPLFLVHADGKRATLRFRFNGWGKKYLLEGDAQVAGEIAHIVELPQFTCPLTFEGGAIEVNGQGIGITTQQCLLHPNRNPKVTQEKAQEMLKNALGIQNLICLERGLFFDHTDGHVDNIARFIEPEVVLCMEPSGVEDPQKEILVDVLAQLKKQRKTPSYGFELFTLPSPGPVVDGQGGVLAASYLNFLISQDQVAVPIFQSPQDEKALSSLEKLFKSKKITPIDCRDLLTGGGTLHCISQPQF